MKKKNLGRVCIPLAKEWGRWYYQAISSMSQMAGWEIPNQLQK